MSDNTFDPVNFTKENMGHNAQPDPAEIQKKMAEAQQKLASIEAEGKAGLENYEVKVKMNGRHEATKVTIEPELMKQPIDVLCELLASAITDASHKTELAIQAEMAKLFG